VTNRRRVLAALLAMQRQSWEQGVLGHALLDLGRSAALPVLARDAVARQTPAGKLAEIEDTGIVNSAANAEGLHRVAAERGDLAVRSGAASYPDDALTGDELLREAEAALDLARLARVSIANRARLA